MSDSPTRFVVSVHATHEPTEDGPRPLPRPFRTAFDRETREEAEALVERLWAAAAETGMRPYLVTQIHPIREASPSRSDPSPAGGGNAEGRCRGAGEILPSGGAILGETLADVLDLGTWTETRFVTTRVGEHGADRPCATVHRFPSSKG